MGNALRTLRGLEIEQFATILNPQLTDVEGNNAFFNNLSIGKAIDLNGVPLLPPQPPPAPLYARALRNAAFTTSSSQMLSTGWTLPASPPFLASPTMGVVDGGIQIPPHIKGWMQVFISYSIDGTVGGSPTSGTLIEISAPTFTTPGGVMNGSAAGITLVRAQGSTFYGSTRAFSVFVDSTAQSGVSLLWMQLGPSSTTPTTLGLYNVVMDALITLIP